ncbi:hypothetical protein AAFF39_00010 [Lactococcus garvieae]
MKPMTAEEREKYGLPLLKEAQDDVETKVTPNTNVLGYSGGCLAYVDDGVNPPQRQPTAQMSWQYAIDSKLAHLTKNRHLMSGSLSIIRLIMDRGQAMAMSHGSIMTAPQSESMIVSTAVVTAQHLIRVVQNSLAIWVGK